MAGVTFLDAMAPRAYSGAPGDLAGLGGTEATLVRICEGLAVGRPVTVRQAARATGPVQVKGVCYSGWDVSCPLEERPDVIVVVNSWKVAAKLARQHPGARVIVWQHVFPGRHNRVYAAGLRAAGIEVICVSAAHARWLRGFAGRDLARISHIPNPIADDMAPDDTARDPDLLLYASSPHKGLAQVFQRFEVLRSRIPTLRLAVADPGYLAWPTGRVPDGVLSYGKLSQADLHQQMRHALCLFYPQDQFAETFGLVIAEANALGCPALLQRGLGANDEVASDPSQCIDTTDSDAIALRVRQWRASPPGTPLAAARPEFRLSRVVALWRAKTACAAAPEDERMLETQSL